MERYTRMRSLSAIWIACFMSSKWSTIMGMCIWIPYSIRYRIPYATNSSACPSTVHIQWVITCATRPGGSISAGRRLIPRWVAEYHCLWVFFNIYLLYTSHTLALFSAVNLRLRLTTLSLSAYLFFYFLVQDPILNIYYNWIVLSNNKNV